MSDPILSVRELQHSDIDYIIQYWMTASESYLEGMGVDINKLPQREQFIQFLTDQINCPIETRKSYTIIWQLDNRPIGHCNTNPTTFGEEALMHLHIWNNEKRKSGLGLQFVRMTLPWFFNNLQLKNLYCQPYALNPGPNKTLQKAGFMLEKEFVTIPGAFNFEQPVKRWHMSKEMFGQL